MRMCELYLLHSYRMLCTTCLKTGHAEETQHMGQNCLVLKPHLRPIGASTAGSETDVATMTILL